MPKATTKRLLSVVCLTLIAGLLFGASQTLPRTLAPERPADLLARLRGGSMPPDFCAVSEGGFQEVSEARSPIRFSLRPESEPRVGESTRLTLDLSLTGGKPIEWSSIRPTHGEKIHLLAISPTLRHYAHLHPSPDPRTGQPVVDFTPQEAGQYRFFVEWMADRTGRMVQGGADLGVEGEETPGLFQPSPGDQQIGPWSFALTTAETLIAGQPSVVSLHIEGEDGRPVALEPVMEAYAHLVAFDRAREGFAHFHPLQEGLDWSPDSARPEIEFVFFTPRAGPYLLWAQLRIDGKDIYVPFALRVDPRRG